MEQDFYLDERGLAAYFEKDWFDHVVRKAGPRALKFEFSPFDPNELHSNYHQRLAQFIAAKVAKPERLLEIGSSLGRTFFEVCQNVPSIQSATLVEPSKNLFDGFQKLFSGQETAGFPVLKGNVEIADVTVDTQAIHQACAQVDFSVLNIPFDKMPSVQQADLVICSNVIDQCKDPIGLVNLLKNLTSPKGYLVISCTYQWQEKYIGNAPEPITDIRDLFGPEWRCLGETNIAFKLRGYERYWLKFLSHVCIFQK